MDISNTSRTRPIARQHQFALLVVMLCLGLLVRIPYLTKVGFYLDMKWTVERVHLIVYETGLLSIYQATDTNYPPLYLAFLGSVGTVQTLRGLPILSPAGTAWDSGLLILIKILPLLAELGLICFIWLWVSELRLRLIITLILTFTPGLFLDSAWWGQSDAILALFLALAMFAVSERKIRLAWVFWAFAVLTKFQAVVLLPVLFGVTFSRYGIRKVLAGVLAALLVGFIGLAPFISANGIPKALNPYIGTLSQFPFLTVGAFNGWMLLSEYDKNTLRTDENPTMLEHNLDLNKALGGITWRTIGLFLLAMYAVFLLTIIHQQRFQHREFIWAAAIYLGFFMLPTQIHERYIYPAIVFLALAIMQDKRVLPLAVISAFTFSYNLILVSEPPEFVIAPLWSPALIIPVIGLNVVVFLGLTIILMRPLRPER